jgi:hypothetical protein
METLEGLDMETTKNIRGEELPPSLRKRFNVRSRDYLTVTVKIRDNEEYDTINVGDDIIESLKEIIDARKKGIELPNARNLLKSL